MPRLLRKLLKWTALIAIGGVLGLGAALEAIVIVAQFGTAYLPVLIAGTLLMTFMAVFVHEAGHALAGLAAGFRIQRFVVWPVEVFRQKPFGVRLINPSRLGWVEATPGFTVAPRWRALLLIGGGVLANFGIAVLCLLLAYWFNEPNLPARPPTSTQVAHRLLVPHNKAAAWLAIAFLLNLFLFLENVIPTQWRNFSSDGYKMLELLRSGSQAEKSRFIGILSAALANGVRPRDWDAGLVERLLRARDGKPGDVMANLYAYYHAVDTGQIRRAGELIDQAAAQCGRSPSNFRHAVLVEAAFFEGRHRHDAVRAQHWLKQVERGQVEEQSRLRAEAGVLLAEGRFLEAAEKVEAALTALSQSADPGGALAEKDWLKDLADEVHRVHNQHRA